MTPTELESPPLGLYVHLPWCVRKCPYCDFNSHQLRGELPAEEYLDALIRDLEQELPLTWGRPVSSVYLGGGTPSLFSAAQIDRLLAAISARMPLAPLAEVTLEANPGTIERDSFSAYREAGVNRVSLGVQSFDDELLQSIGRIHERREVEQSLASLHRAGLENFNIDLMYGLPGQHPEQALQDLQLALEAQPAHLSHYQLTLEPNTVFAAEPPALPGEEACWGMQEAAADLLTGGHYRQYEISAWSLDGRRSMHNLNYWRFGDYLGIGAGAHAKLTDPTAGVVRRRVKTRHPRRYMTDPGAVSEQVVAPRELVFEYFLNHLRLRDNIDPGHFSKRTGLPWSYAAAQVGEAVDKGLLESGPDGFSTTPLGWRFVNDLQAVFLP